MRRMARHSLALRWIRMGALIWALVGCAAAPIPLVVMAVVGAGAAYYYKVLDFDQSGEIPTDNASRVTQVQTELTALGYHPGPIDGVLGQKTRSAIQAFQVDHGRPPDGIPNNNLLLELRYQRAFLADHGSVRGETVTTGQGSQIGTREVVVSDQSCEQMVVPYGLTSNLSQLVETVLKQAQVMLKKGPESWRDDVLIHAVRTIAKRTNWMPMELEVRYGQQIHEERLSDKRIFKRTSKSKRTQALYAQADKVLADLLVGVNDAHPFEFKLFIANRSDIYAEAIPGGYLYVSSGALEQGYASFALGHEVAHVLQRHTTFAFQARLVESTDTFKDIKALMTQDEAVMTEGVEKLVALPDKLLRYEQSQEMVADTCSVRMLVESPAYDANQETSAYLKHLEAVWDGKREGKDGYVRLPWMGRDLMIREGEISSHPEFPERRDRIKKALALIH